MNEKDSNKPKKLLIKKVMQFTGFAFIAIGALTIIGWMQSRDPDCALAEVETTESYLRMCDANIANIQAASWWLFLGCVAAIILGLFLIRLSNKK